MLVFFLLLISLPNLIDLENYRPRILAYLKSRVAGEVSVGQLGLAFLHGPGLRVDGVKVFDRDGSQHLFVTTAIINFDLWSLFQRRLHLSRLTLVQPEVVLKIDSTKSTLTDFFLFSKSSVPVKDHGANFGGLKFDGEISGARIEIVDGSVEFTDDCFGAAPITTRLEKLNSLFLWKENGSLTDFKLTSEVRDKAGYGSLRIEGTLSDIKFPLAPGRMMLDCQVKAENLNGGTYFPYYQEYVPMRFIGGRVDIDANYKGSLLGLFHSKGQIVIRQAELDYQQVFSRKLKFKRFAVDYDFRLADSYNTIETRDCTINADGLIVRGYCLLHEARRGIDGSIKAKLSSSKVEPKTVLPLLPWKIIPDQIYDYCRHLQGPGPLQVENAYLQGTYRKLVKVFTEDPPAEDIIGGQLHGENLSFTAMDGWPSVTLDNVNLILAGNALKASNIGLSVQNFLTCQSGILALQDLYYKPSLSFSGRLKFDLPGLDRYFKNSSGSTVKKQEPKNTLPITFDHGLLVGELTCKGPLTRPDLIRWQGTFKGEDISFTVTGTPFKVEHGAAVCNLANDVLRIDSAVFDFAGSPVAVQGTLPGPNFFLHGEGRSDLNITARSSEVTPAQFDLLSGNKYGISGMNVGPSMLEVSLNADVKDPSGFILSGMLDLQWAEVKLPFIPKRVERLDCKAVFDRKRIVCENLILRRGQSEFLFHGDLHQDEAREGYVLAGEIGGSYLAVDDFFSAEEQKVDFRQSQLKLGFNLKGSIGELVLPATAAGSQKTTKSWWPRLYGLNFSLSRESNAPIIIQECRWQWGDKRAKASISGKLQNSAVRS